MVIFYFLIFKILNLKIAATLDQVIVIIRIIKVSEMQNFYIIWIFERNIKNCNYSMH